MAVAVVLGVLVVGAGAALIVIPALDDEEAYPEPDRPVATSVGAIVDVPPRWYRQIVEVSGRATPLTDRYFLLTGSDAAIVVRQGTVDPAGAVEDGERIRVIGVVTKMNRIISEELGEIAGATAPAGVAWAGTDLGDPLISAERITAARGSAG